MKKIILISALFIGGLMSELNAQPDRPYHMRKNNRYGNVSNSVESSESTARTYAMKRHNLWHKNQESDQTKNEKRTYRMRRQHLFDNHGSGSGQSVYHLKKHNLKTN